MAVKRAKGFGDVSRLDDIEKIVNKPVKIRTRKKIGRPKQNPYDEDKKLTFRVPKGLHKQLRYASVYQDKPMVEIVVDALVKHLKVYEDK